MKQKLIESELYKDIHKLEGLFYKKYRDQLYNDRRKLIEGPHSQPTIVEESEEGEGSEAKESVTNEEHGIPKFWLRVLLNSKNLRQIVQVIDSYLEDISLHF